MSSAIRLVRENPSQRRHLRVSAPISIQIKCDSSQHTAVNWSIGGFLVSQYRGTLKCGEESVVTVSIPFSGFDVSFDAGFRVVRVDSTAHVLAGEFLNLDEKNRSVLKYFSDSLIQGEMESIGDTIRRLDIPVTKVSEKPDATPGKDLAAETQTRTRNTLLFSLLYLLAGGLLFAYMSATIYSHVNTVKAEVAAITGADQLITSPFSGEVEFVYADAGDSIEKDAPLILIRNDEIIESIELARMNVLDAQADLQEKQQLLQSQQDKLKSYLGFTRNELQIAQANYRALADRHIVAKRNFARVETLHSKGLTSEAALDLAANELTGSRAALDIAKAQQEMAERALSEIGEGRYFADHRFQTAIDDLQSAVDAAGKRAGIEQARLKILEKRLARLTIPATSSGTIAAINVRPHQTISKGDVIMTLESEGAREIEAFIPVADLAHINIGSIATVQLQDRNRPLSATVHAIDRNIANHALIRDSIANTAAIDGATSLVRIKLGFANPLDAMDLAALPSGYPVTVEVERHHLIESAFKSALAQLKNYQERYL